MRVAFYAPLKPLDHPVPSGDRQLARALAAALAAAGHDVRVASRLRSYDRAGDDVRQRRLRALGAWLATRTIRQLDAAAVRPDVWFTYHLYHKAPDWLGPRVSAALGIPYLVAEASVATKQAAGRWAIGHAGAVDAITRATAVVHVNPADVGAIRALRGDAADDLLLPPFIDIAQFVGGARQERRPGAGDRVRLVVVAMMREDAKLASYRLLAAALDRIAAKPWELEIIGDGPARRAVETAFSALPGDRVRYTGALAPPTIAARLATSDLFVWPAIDEAFGMALIEAQACGLPVVAGRSPGVAAVVADGRTALLTPAGDIAAFAAAIERLVDDVPLRRQMGAAAAGRARARHDVSVAVRELDQLLRRVTQRIRPPTPALR
jgi:glycosyltransferase involved in cell wall biosynthesis